MNRISTLHSEGILPNMTFYASQFIEEMKIQNTGNLAKMDNTDDKSLNGH